MTQRIEAKRFQAGLAGFAGGSTLIALLFFVFHGGAIMRADLSSDPPPVTAEKIAELLPYERDLVDVFHRVSPAVVNVSNLAQRRARYSLDVQEIPQGTGTGFVWDKAGHIVTNYHVIHEADAVSVNFADHTQRRATVVGAYPSKDLAVLKIDLPSNELTPLVCGNSHDLLVGQTVLAIGNPFGLDHTLTTGVVSALGREIKALDGRPIQDVIQTDASINPGNSGGPLLDSRGRLIGVNTAIFSPSGVSAGIGFAIPVDTVTAIVTQLVEHGKVVRPGIGVRLFPDDVAGRLRIQGAIIASVDPSTAADKAGLQGVERTEEGEIRLGDVITGVDGKKITSNDDLFKTIERYKVGDTIELTYLRDGKERKVKVKLQSI
jgi:protease Do-like 1, chloroplastic